MSMENQYGRKAMGLTLSFLIAPMALGLATITSANATVTQIVAMTNPNVVIDFGTFATGPTSLSAINAAAPGAGITSLVFTETGGTTGVYDSDLGSGNAVGPDGSGGLIIVPELGRYGDATALTITLDHYATQFGFQLADRSDSKLEFFDGLTSVGSIFTPDIQSPPVTDFFESTVAFNRIVISQAANWVIPELVIESAVPVPAALPLMFGALAVAGVVARRKR